MAPTEPDSADGNSKDSLVLIANVHYVLTGLFVIVVVASIPILLGALAGISLLGTAGTGVPATAKGPVLEYVRTTGPFPDSGPMLHVLGFVRNGGLVAVLFLTGVGLEHRLRSAWYATLAFYGLVVIASWPNPVGILIGGLGVLIVWSGRDAITTTRSVTRELAILCRGVRDKQREIRAFDLED